jgi:hypothetical protein
MTPQQAAADLDAIVADIDAALDSETADRQYQLEDTRARLAALARQFHATPAMPGTGTATGPGQLADRLTGLLGGPHADEHTTAAAWLASEAARFLNYATGPHASTGLRYPATVYSIAGALAEMAGRLPQLFGQFTAWLDAEQAAGRLAEDHGGPVAPLTDRARHHLDQAARHATALGAALSWAQCDLAALHTAEGSQS